KKTEWDNRKLIIVNMKKVFPHDREFRDATIKAREVFWKSTRDHSFEQRIRLGGPLLKENIATIVLESPFYGQRQSFLQSGSKLLFVNDLLLLGRATIEEARSLLHWLECEEGYRKMGVCGLSMGGVHAPVVLSLHPTPVAKFSFLSPQSAVVAFCKGVLKHVMALNLYIMMQ
nr:hypothetical protein [Tanacetum cinerariifolium]